MSEFLPDGEDLRRAVTWISERRKDGPVPLATLIDEASRKFDLSPVDQEFLWRTLSKPASE